MSILTQHMFTRYQLWCISQDIIGVQNFYPVTFQVLSKVCKINCFVLEKKKKLVSINEVVLDMLRLPPWGFKRLDMEMRKICGIYSHANCQGINAILFTHKNNSKSICIVQPCMFLYIQLIDILLPCKMFYSKTVLRKYHSADITFISKIPHTTDVH